MKTLSADPKPFHVARMTPKGSIIKKASFPTLEAALSALEEARKTAKKPQEWDVFIT